MYTSFAMCLSIEAYVPSTAMPYLEMVPRTLHVQERVSCVSVCHEQALPI
jgi:hypothetical protein